LSGRASCWLAKLRICCAQQALAQGVGQLRVLRGLGHRAAAASIRTWPAAACQ
jgi:hypothetical protein